MIHNAVQADRIYKAGEVAELLKVNEQTVRRWLRDGDLEGRLLGDRGGWRIVGADLIAFWDKQGEGKE